MRAGEGAAAAATGSSRWCSADGGIVRHMLVSVRREGEEGEEDYAEWTVRHGAPLDTDRSMEAEDLTSYRQPLPRTRRSRMPCGGIAARRNH